MSSQRTAAILRLVSSLALWVALLAVFHQPMITAFGPWLGPAVAEIEDGGWLSGTAKGFMLQAVVDPPGSEVWVNGTLRGRAPVIANIQCREGEAVTLRLRHEGYRDFEQTLACREGGSLRVRLRLQP